MGLFDRIRNIFRPAGSAEPAGRFGIDELARRLGVSVDVLQKVPIVYREFEIPKRSGGTRRIAAPAEDLQTAQKLILRRVLDRLRAHDAAHGFEIGRSIVTNALPHQSAAVVLKLDVKDFFASTTTRRVRAYFRAIGWDAAAADALVRICTHRGGLPQGAPTSPRLSNLVNYPLDVRLWGVAAGFRRVTINPKTLETMLQPRMALHAAYTRYADDITLSFREDHRDVIHTVVRIVKKVLEDYGYQLHQRAKLQIRRRHERQMVTGLIANDHVQLPREARRRMRAIGHRLKNGRAITIDQRQWAGWQSLAYMVKCQASGA